MSAYKPIHADAAFEERILADEEEKKAVDVFIDDVLPHVATVYKEVQVQRAHLYKGYLKVQASCYLALAGVYRVLRVVRNV